MRVRARGGQRRTSLDQTIDLVLLQGNRFIRGFLRESGLPIGVNKHQFEAHLREGITTGQVTPADIQAWLGEVEGWGNQHAFVFDVPSRDIAELVDAELFAGRVEAAGFGELLNAPIPLDPGEDLALATIGHHAEGISFLWVRGSPGLIRRKDLDVEREIEGDEIEFHAYERRWSRVAARFELRFDSDIAAVFLTQHEDRNYAEQREVVLQSVDRVMPARRGWDPLDISRVITQLDTAGLDGQQDGAPPVRMASTVFQGASASIRLAANTQASGYQDDAGVRQVRLAVNPAQFVGGSGDCYLTPGDNADGDPLRELHLRLYGRDQRVLLWGKMSAEEVWAVITDLRAYAA